MGGKGVLKKNLHSPGHGEGVAHGQDVEDEDGEVGVEEGDVVHQHGRDEELGRAVRVRGAEQAGEEDVVGRFQPVKDGHRHGREDRSLDEPEQVHLPHCL